MGVDKGYGSGKPRSAANSRARQRSAAGSFTKGPKQTTRTLKKIAAENPVTGFIGGGVLASKGFANAATKLAGVAQKRFGIQEMKQTMAARQGYTSTLDDRGRGILVSQKSPLWKFESRLKDKELYVNDLISLTPWAVNRAARDLRQTIGRKSAYTALRGEAAASGRNLAKDIRNRERAIVAERPGAVLGDPKVRRAAKMIQMLEIDKGKTTLKAREMKAEAMRTLEGRKTTK